MRTISQRNSATGFRQNLEIQMHDAVQVLTQLVWVKSIVLCVYVWSHGAKTNTSVIGRKQLMKDNCIAFNAWPKSQNYQSDVTVRHHDQYWLDSTHTGKIARNGAKQSILHITYLLNCNTSTLAAQSAILTQAIISSTKMWRLSQSASEITRFRISPTTHH